MPCAFNDNFRADLLHGAVGEERHIFASGSQQHAPLPRAPVHSLHLVSASHMVSPSPFVS